MTRGALLTLGAAPAFSAQLPSHEDLKNQADAAVDPGRAKVVTEQAAK